ncbi:MAG: cell division protein ZapA [Thermodesulfobacteriota bacterium]|nr:cell division protein ZapA [Thermodesulfobacteriota bacterium]
MIKIDILGKIYTVTSEINEEKLKEITEYLNKQVKEVSNQVKSNSEINILILTALNVTNDYLKMKNYKEELIRGIESRSLLLNNLIDKNLL